MHIAKKWRMANPNQHPPSLYLIVPKIHLVNDFLLCCGARLWEGPFDTGKNYDGKDKIDDDDDDDVD